MLAIAAAALQAQTGDPSALASGWVRESWSIADGLPVNSINGLIQSRTGYVWLATFDGLVRFDGVRFTVYNSANSPGLPSDRIMSVMETRDSALWLLTEQRYLVRFARGRFTPIDESRGLVGGPFAIYEDPSGQLFIGSEQGLGRMEGDRLVPVDPEVIRGKVLSIVRRRDGSLWVGHRNQRRLPDRGRRRGARDGRSRTRAGLGVHSCGRTPKSACGSVPREEYGRSPKARSRVSPCWGRTLGTFSGSSTSRPPGQSWATA